MTTTTTNSESRSPFGLYDDDPRKGLAVPGSDMERNGYHDSDFSIMLWNPDDGKFETRRYGTTSYPSPTSWPKADDWWLNPGHPEYSRALATARASVIGFRLAVILAEARKVQVGSRVRVVKPTKTGKNSCPEGATGTIGWMQERRSQYGTWSQGWKFGVDLDDETEIWQGREKPRRVFVASGKVTLAEAPATVDDLPPEVVAEVHDKWDDAPAEKVWQALVSGSSTGAAMLLIGHGPRLADD